MVKDNKLYLLDGHRFRARYSKSKSPRESVRTSFPTVDVSAMALMCSRRAPRRSLYPLSRVVNFLMSSFVSKGTISSMMIWPLNWTMPEEILSVKVLRDLMSSDNWLKFDLMSSWHVVMAKHCPVLYLIPRRMFERLSAKIK